MKTLRSTAIILFGFLSFCANAEFAEVDVNGTVITPDLFSAYAKHYLVDEENCPPTSDALVKANVIDWMLIAEEAEKLNVTIATQYEDRYQRRLLERSDMVESAHAQRSKLMMLAMREQYLGRRNAMLAPISQTEIEARYLSMQESHDPLISDVIMIKFELIEVETEAQVLQAQEKLGAGLSFNEVAKLYDDNADLPQSSRTNWNLPTLVRYPYIVPDDAEIGDVLGPIQSKWWWALLHVLDKKHIPLMALNDEFEPLGTNVRTLVKHRVQTTKWQDVLKPLREQAIVTEKGKTLTLPLETKKCGRN